MSVGWIVVSVFSMTSSMPATIITISTELLTAMIVGLGMAEVVSAIPTSGGPYFWAARLAPAKHAAFASWITGWYTGPIS